MAATLSFNGVSFDPETGELGGAASIRYRLPRYVSAVLAPLMTAGGGVVKRGALVDAMWNGRPDGPQDKCLDVTVHRLRRDLAGIGAPIFVENVFGVGYRLTVEKPARRQHICCPHCGESLHQKPARRAA